MDHGDLRLALGRTPAPFRPRVYVSLVVAGEPTIEQVEAVISKARQAGAPGRTLLAIQAVSSIENQIAVGW